MFTNTSVQIESKTLWDLVVAETCGCTELHKCCDGSISEGTYGEDKLPCKYACENAGTKRMYLTLLKDNDLLRKAYPVFWKKTAFKAEIAAVLGWLHRWEPNGDWDLYDLLDTPWQTIEALENYKAGLEDAYQDVPDWVDDAITYLMLLARK